jgi:hypothetical protein
MEKLEAVDLFHSLIHRRIEMIDRIMGVFRLSVPTFEEIEADESATGQAAIVVAIVAILAGIGAFLAVRMAAPALAQLEEQFGGEMPIAIPELSPVGALINAILGAFIAWLIWSALTYFIGTRLFGGVATMGEMLRVIGFAQAPRMLSVLGFIPCIGSILSLVGWIWSLVASFIGIRQGLDLDNGKTALTVILSFLGALLINFLIGLILAPIFALAP